MNCPNSSDSTTIGFDGAGICRRLPILILYVHTVQILFDCDRLSLDEASVDSVRSLRAMSCSRWSQQPLGR